MKTVKYFLLFFFLINSNNQSIAQTDNHPWCPNGATWLYQRIGFFSQEHIKLSYIKDTVINNVVTKVLQVSNITITGPGPLPNYAWNELQDGYEYYSMSNDSIYRWHNGQFLFLYDFSTFIGEKWAIYENDDYPCNNATLPSTDTFSVTSVSNQVYDGITFETITGTDKNNWTIGANIVKNIGSLETPYPIPINNACYGIDGGTHLPFTLNCYYDDLRGSINFNTPPSNDCHFAFTPVKQLITDNNKELSVTIFPNPTTNIINIINNNILAIEKYEIFDLNGTKIGSGILSPAQPISFQDYPNGVYFLILISDKSSFHPFKIIKS